MSADQTLQIHPKVTLCLLTYGDYPNLAQRALNSIRLQGPRTDYKLTVGANSVCEETLDFIETRHEAGEIDRLIVSSENLCKCPMMRQMFAGLATEYVWWFDDDSYVTGPKTLSQWLQIAESAPASTVMWGSLGCCQHPLAFTELEDVIGFVRSAPWYRGLPPPTWKPGGKGEFNFQGQNKGDGRWFFIFGGCWMMRTCAIRTLDWPDMRLTQNGDDVILGEAIRQQGWNMGNIGPLGVRINTEARRGAGRDLFARLSARKEVDEDYERNTPVTEPDG
ncbi:MAG: hypothetical protein HY694_05605 [Deltaproteobacteria bacterium]|nr:hypothetical protein [Deltaproteobacteria bacterium]